MRTKKIDRILYVDYCLLEGKPTKRWDFANTNWKLHYQKLYPTYLGYEIEISRVIAWCKNRQRVTIINMTIFEGFQRRVFEVYFQIKTRRIELTFT